MATDHALTIPNLRADLARPAALAHLHAEIERRGLVGALRAHPQWRLADLDRIMAGESRLAEPLGRITITELLNPPGQLDLDPLVDHERLTRAQTLSGADFDAVVLEVVAEAGEHWVGSSHIKARVGGPRWKLLKSLGRLVGAGKIERRGTTSGTQYRHVRRSASQRQGRRSSARRGGA